MGALNMADIRKVELKNGGTRYRTRVRVQGRQVVRQFRSHADAKAWSEQQTHDRVAGVQADPVAGRQTLRELYIEVGQVRKYAPATTAMRATAWKHVPPNVQELKIAAIDVTVIDRVLSKVAAPAMRAKLQSVLSGLFAYAISKRRLTLNPAKRPGFRKTRAEEVESESAPQRVLSDDELARLVDAMPARYRALVQIMAAVGLRPGEALAMRSEDFDPTDGALRVRGTKTGTALRTVILPRQIGAVLEAHIRRFSSWEPGSLVFTTDGGTAIDLHNFRARVFTTAAKKAGVNSGLRIYDLRHTAASRALMNGAPLVAVAAMLGHKDATVTLSTYAHAMDSDQRKLADLLDRSLDRAWIDVPEAAPAR